MRIILVHGRSQGGKNAEELRLFWAWCLDKSFRDAGLSLPTGTEVVLPFYADDLDRLVAQVNTPLVTDILLRGEKNVSSREVLRVEILREMLDAKGISDEKVLVGFQGQPLERGPQNWPWVLAMLKALDSTPLGAHAIDSVTRDVCVYLTFLGIREKIDAIVRDAIPEDRCVVVAHSLGTVVAYNVLSTGPRGSTDVSLFLTLGSPLGIQAIASRLNKPLATPPGVKNWLNARDPRDVVALYPLDQDHFDVRPAIKNDSRVDNFTENRHSIEGYLADREVARRIHAALSA